MQAKILLTDAENQNTLAAARYLSQANFAVYLIGSRRFALTSLSKHNKKYFKINPKASWEDQVSQIILENKIDYLIPIGYQSVMKCSAARVKLKKIVKFTLPNEKTLKLTADKNSLINLAKKKGISCPKTIAVDNVNAAVKAAVGLGYPVVVKPALEGLRPCYPRSSQELKECLGRMLRKKNKILIQEYIEGDGYGYFALCKEGTPKMDFMHHRLREYPLTGGASTSAESFRDETLRELGSKLLKKLRWTGVAMVEFKKNKLDGKYYLMEINPKFWGSLELALVSGVDFLSALIKLTGGEKVRKFDYRTGVKFQWPFPYDFQRSFGKPKDFVTFFFDLFNPKVKKDFWLSDPLPSLFQLLASLKFKDKYQ